MSAAPRDRPLTHQGGPFVQTSAPPGVINLGLGQPSPQLLPLAALADAAAATLGPGGDPLILQYGALQGYAGFREALATYLSEAYGAPVRPEELMVTGGTSSALTLVSETFGRPGATVVSEDPTYFLAHGIFASAGLEIVGVAVDGDGLEVDALAARLDAGLRPAFVYVIPRFQNPTAVSLSDERAAALVELAARYDFIIIADEPYPCLHFGPGPGPGSLVRFDAGRGRVVSLGSFSKLLAPGLRLGWAHAAPELIERLANHGALRSGGCLNPVIARLVHHCLETGFVATHVAGLRAQFGARVEAMTAALREHLPTARFVPPTGGYFCWVELPEGSDTDALLARSDTVRFIPGSRCAVDRDLRRCLRLSFAFYEADEIEDGVARLGQLVT